MFLPHNYVNTLLKVLGSNLVSVHLILDEQKYTIYENYFIIIRSRGVLVLSIANLNSVKLTINHPLPKLSPR